MTTENLILTTLSEILSRPQLMEIDYEEFSGAVFVYNGKRQRLVFHPQKLFKSAQVTVSVDAEEGEYGCFYDTIATIKLRDKHKARQMYTSLVEEYMKRKRQLANDVLSNFVVDKA